MSNTQKSIRSILLIVMVFSSFLFITSCDNKAEQQLMALTDLVPKDSVDQIAYITQAIQLYNTYQIAKTSTSRVGHPISQELSNLITAPIETNCLDTTKAVFFSFVNIFESLTLIGGDINENSGIAVVFGKYPDVIGDTFKAELEAKGLVPSEYAGRSTVVLKYVKNLNPALDNTSYYRKTEGGNEKSGPDQIISNMGMPCPKNCPTGTN